MHESFFSYNLTRPYPYNWFSPVALVGAAVLLALLSVMNFVQNSYNLEVAYVSDPNSTVTNGVWYSHWPSYLTSSVKPTCQPANIPVGTQFFTNQTGLTWTLTNVWREGEQSAALPSLPYLNNEFGQCDVRDIQVSFGGSQLVQTAQSLGTIVTSSDVQVRAFVTCGLWSPIGYTKINATAMYDTISANAVAGSIAFVAQNATSKASMYWAEALLSAFWLQTEGIVGGGLFATYSLYPGKGLVVLYPSASERNITSLDFFDVTYTFLQAPLPSNPKTMALSSAPLDSVRHYVETGEEPHFLWLPLDGLTKAMYSAVLTDLGQVNAPLESNIVASPPSLQYFTTNFSAAAWLSEFYHLPIVDVEPYNVDQASDHPTGPLSITPSVISTSYLCQIPRRRPWGDIFIAVLLADLVLLQAAWRLYTFGVDYVLVRRRNGAKFCEGCAVEEGDGYMGADERKMVGLKGGGVMSYSRASSGGGSGQSS